MTIRNALYRQGMKDLHDAMAAADEAFARDDADDLAYILGELLGSAKRFRDALASKEAKRRIETVV